MKKLVKLSLLFSLALILAQTAPVYGVISPFQQRQQQDNRQMNQGTNSALQNQIRQQTKANRAELKQAKIANISGTTITADKNGLIYTVLTGTFNHCTTQFRRRFWGKSYLSEMSVGDEINVHGRWQNNDSTTKTIEACLVRDLSIQMKSGVFIGTIVNLTAEGFTFDPAYEKYPNQTVIVNSNTQYYNRKMQPLHYQDLQAGHRLRIHGVWNRITNVIGQVSKIKDFTLPLQPKTGTPSAAINELEVD